MSLSKLHCIIDCSGSMAEYGKPMLLVNLLRYTRQFSELRNINTCYFRWQKELAEVHWPVDADIDLPNAEGSSDISALCRWGEENSDVTLLVLTDGYFGLNTEQRQRLSQLENLYLVGVGGDADLVQLNTLSNYSFRAEQLDHALHSISRPEAAVVGPTNRVELAGTVQSEPEDDW